MRKLGGVDTGQTLTQALVEHVTYKEQTESSGMGSDLTSARRTNGLDLCRSTLCPYWRRSSLQAPTELQNNLCCNHVTIANEPAGAVMHPLLEALFCNRVALRAGLTCVAGVHFHDCTTSVLSFFAQPGKEVTPSNISNRFSEFSARQPVDCQTKVA